MREERGRVPVIAHAENDHVERVVDAGGFLRRLVGRVLDRRDIVEQRKEPGIRRLVLQQMRLDEAMV
ncbi:Uncharacterised protein [Mycobacterium tuberculosis]|nr:Uncharacterised protein [Mycobacterium tuberculosis]